APESATRDGRLPGGERGLDQGGLEPARARDLPEQLFPSHHDLFNGQLDTLPAPWDAGIDVAARQPADPHHHHGPQPEADQSRKAPAAVDREEQRQRARRKRGYVRPTRDGPGEREPTELLAEGI